MARGLPDYSTVSRILYGTTKIIKGSEVLAPADHATYLSQKKGVLLGGFLSSNDPDDGIIAFVDGASFGKLTHNTVNNFGLTTPKSGHVYQLKFDAVNSIYTLGFFPDFSFNSTLLIVIHKNAAGQTDWKWYYAEIS